MTVTATARVFRRDAPLGRLYDGKGMKPLDELTRLGRIRRMRALASADLAEYGLGRAHFYLVRQAGKPSHS